MMDMINEADVWERINAEIKKKKLSKKEVARRCGFERKSLYGNRNIWIVYFSMLCKVLNVSADYLLFGNDWDTEEC